MDSFDITLNDVKHLYKGFIGLAKKIKGQGLHLKTVQNTLHDDNPVGYRDISIERVSDGVYRIKSPNLFTLGLTEIHCSNTIAPYRIEKTHIDASNIEIKVCQEEGGPGIDNSLWAPIKIAVYESEEKRAETAAFFGV